MPLRSVVLLGLVAILAGCTSWTISPAPRSSPSASPGSDGPPASSLTGPPAASPSPTLTPAELPELIGNARIPFADRWMQVHIVGRPGVVTSWRATTDRELNIVDWQDQEIGLARLDRADLVLGWIGTVCDVEATLTINVQSLAVTPVPRKGCDLVGVGRGLVLTYAGQVDPQAIDLTLGERLLLPEQP